MKAINPFGWLASTALKYIVLVAFGLLVAAYKDDIATKFQAWKHEADAVANLQKLEAALEQAKALPEEAAKRANDRLARLEKASTQALASERQRAESELAAINRTNPRSEGLELLLIDDLPEHFRKRVRAEELAFVIDQITLIQDVRREQQRKNASTSYSLQQQYKALAPLLKSCLDAQAALTAFDSQHSSRIGQLIYADEGRQLRESQNKECRAYNAANRSYAGYLRASNTASVAVKFAGATAKAFELQLGLAKEAITRHSVSKLARARESLPSVLMYAALTLLGILLGPPAIRAAFYFGLARWAGSRPPIRLLPDTKGELRPLTASTAGVSVEIAVGDGYEFVVGPEYMQSTSTAGEKSTRWLLDWSMPFTSLLTGMAGLTRIHPGGRVVVSATRDPLNEVALLEVPDGSALVLQPHYLVGVLYATDRPPRITRHWQLGRLSAWMTLQFRYIVFHGPVTLVVRGCRGVRIEDVATGRNVEQAATMGFSANLDYSCARSETFGAYLLGKRSILNDRFAGGPGYVVYEEMPYAGKRTGVTGRGLEGFVDMVRSMFGL